MAERSLMIGLLWEDCFLMLCVVCLNLVCYSSCGFLLEYDFFFFPVTYYACINCDFLSVYISVLSNSENIYLLYIEKN